MIRQLLTAGAATVFSTWGMAALANNCADRTMVIERLQSKYHETLAAGGLQKRADTMAVVEVWASEETGTFTVMLTRPDGVSCVVATGTDWHQISPEEIPEDVEG
ncbi:MAG: hypothetical protein AAGA28_10645 [Pseudomonadota bacterium]